jgi:hypothetical protein
MITKYFFRIAIYFLFIPFTFSSLQAQVTKDLPNYFPVSPNAASFAKQGVYPVDYSTGKLNVSVPIYTIKTKELTVPISLSYNTSGIQLNETASWVGLGWNLNAGGAIVRNTKGKPDGSLGTQNWWKPIPALSSSFAFTKENYDALYYMQNGERDTAPDEYVVNAPGLSGSFYFDQNDSYKAYFRDFQNTKVRIISNTEIEITKDDGTIYKFGKNIQGVESLEITSNPIELVQSIGSDFISAWYLTEIISANGKEQISFKYKTVDSIDYSVVTSENLVFRGGGTDPSIQGNYPHGDGSNSVTIKKQFLQTITFANGKIDFISTLDRQDLTDDYKLNSIEVSAVLNNQNTLVQKSSFSYDYYSRSGGGISPSSLTDPLANNAKIQNSKSYALRLKEILNNNTNTKHSFDYNNASPIARRGSTGQDYWGYMNGNTGSLIPPTTLSVKSTIPVNEKDISFGDGNRKADENLMKSGILERITYPEGGYTVFEYEANKYVKDIKSTVMVDKSSDHTMVYSRTNNCTPSYKETPFIVGPSYVKGSGKISYFFSSAINEPSGANSYVKWDNTIVYRLNYDPQKGSYPNSSENVSEDFRAGPHLLTAAEYRIGADGILGCTFISIGATWKEATGTVTTPTTIFVGGLRVKSIKNYLSGSTLPVTEKQYAYEQENVLNEEGMGIYSRKVITYENTSLARPVCSSSTIYNNNIGGGPNMTYGKVIETEITADPLNTNQKINNGKTEYYFENVPAKREVDVFPTVFKHPNYNTMSTSPLLSYATSISDFGYYKNDLWNYGSLLETKYYKKDQSNTFKLIKSMDNNYQNLIEKNLSTNVVFNTLEVPYDASNQEFTKEPYTQAWDHYSAQFFYFTGGISLGKKVMKSTTETDYDANENPTTQKTTTYSYDNSIHNQVTKIEITNSVNVTLKTQLSYPQDLLITGQKAEMQKLVNQNRIDKPIKTETFVNDVKTSESVTKYEVSTMTGNLLLPKEIHSLKGLGNTFPFNDENRKISFSLYDTNLVNGSSVGNGNVLEYKLENGAPVSIIWGYSKTQPIAKIENATYTSIPAATIMTLQNLSDADTDNCVNATCKEQNLRAALSSLRSSLPNAMVTTYTYNPLIGVTSITDAKGLTSYYEYDEFNRLKFVIDQDLNILQRNCYNYKGQQINCSDLSSTTATLFNSTAKSGIFTRNNCASGYSGTSVTYTVGAGSYYSLFSQTDADTKAQTDVTNNGQTYANTYGSCFTIPSAPTGLKLTSSTTNSLSLSWTAVAWATGYKIYKDGVYLASTILGGMLLTGLNSSSTYGIQVLAYNALGDGPLCTSVSMATSSFSNEGSIYNGTGHTISASTMKIFARSTANGSFGTMCSVKMPALAAGATFLFSTNYASPILSNGTFELILYSATGIAGTNYFMMENGSASTNGYFSNSGGAWEATVTSTGPQNKLSLTIK